MIQILLITGASALFSVSFKKKIHTLLPVTIMAAMLVMYIFALFAGNLRICTLAALFLLIVSAVVSFYKKRKDTDTIRELLLTPQILVLFITCLVFFFLFSNRKVFNWDDLSYWGIYAKDLFYLNRLPLGTENCTISYKDYTPILQLAQTFFTCFSSSFNESRLFQINICFLYILMLPFLDLLDRSKKWYERFGIIILFIIFPHVFTTQFYYKLGVDYLISILFGYGLYLIKLDHFKVSGFKMTALVTVTSFLALIKTSGIVLGLFLMLFYLFCTVDPEDKTIIRSKDKLSILSEFAVITVPLIFYFSWKAWGKISLNHGYLSDRVTSNMKDPDFKFPEYTRSVVLDYIKHVFTYPLTREKFGITAFIIILCIFMIYYLQKRNLPEKEASVLRRMHYMMTAGLFIFCLAHIYMYLFVFDDWEALGLLEFDRYICQYLAGVLYFYSYSLWESCSLFINKKQLKVNLAIPFCILFIVFLPYPAIKQYLFPDNYNRYYEANWKPFRDTALSELERSGLKDLQIPYDNDHRLMLIGSAWQDEAQYFTYEMVPQPVVIIANVPAMEEGSLQSFINYISDDRNVRYVYVMEGAEQLYTGDFKAESATLTMDQTPLKEGNIYIREDSDNGKLYKLLNSPL